jgi:hypothetical protein
MGSVAVSPELILAGMQAATSLISQFAAIRRDVASGTITEQQALARFMAIRFGDEDEAIEEGRQRRRNRDGMIRGGDG